MRGCLLMIKSHVAADPHRVASLKTFLAERGIRILQERRLEPGPELDVTMHELYKSHAGKPYFERLIASVKGGVIALYVSKPRVFHRINSMDDNAVLHTFIANMRTLVGPTNPEEARKTSPHTIRGKLTLPTEALPLNVVHCSDGIDEAKRELALLFPMFVFDFEGVFLHSDCGLHTKRDVELTLPEVDSMSAEAFEALWSNLAFVRSLLHHLSTVSGCEVHILTLGKQRLVRALLRRGGLLEYVNAIHAPSMFGHYLSTPLSDLKRVTLESLATEASLPHSCIVFIDSDYRVVYQLAFQEFSTTQMDTLDPTHWATLPHPQHTFVHKIVMD